MKWKLFITLPSVAFTLPSVAWYLKIGEAENILSEWDKVMKVSILCKSFSSGGKKKSITDILREYLPSHLS